MTAFISPIFCFTKVFGCLQNILTLPCSLYSESLPFWKLSLNKMALTAMFFGKETKKTFDYVPFSQLCAKDPFSIKLHFFKVLFLWPASMFLFNLRMSHRYPLLSPLVFQYQPQSKTSSSLGTENATIRGQKGVSCSPTPPSKKAEAKNRRPLVLVSGSHSSDKHSCDLGHRT